MQAGELLGRSSLPVTSIRMARDVVFFTAAAPGSRPSDPIGENGVFRIDPGARGVVRRVCAWSGVLWLLAIDDDHVYFGDGCVRRVRVEGGEVRRVLLNGFMVVRDGDDLYGSGYTYLVHAARQPSYDGNLDDEEAQPFDIFYGGDPRKIAVGARHLLATLGDPPHQRGSREVLVTIPKRDLRATPTVVASLREQVAQLEVVGDTVVLLFHGGPLATLSIDGGAIRDVPGTEGVERFQIVGERLAWVPPFEPHARLVSAPATDPRAATTIAALGHESQPPFWITESSVVWAEPLPASYREDGATYGVFRTRC